MDNVLVVIGGVMLAIFLAVLLITVVRSQE